MAMSTKAEQQAYQKLAQRHAPSKPILRNTVRAFLVGGVICLLGQVIQNLFIQYGHFTEKTAGNPTVAVLIFLSVVFTSFGVYDRFAIWAGCGSAVPVTGFANTMASAAMEFRAEGWIVGVGANMFRLAGPVVIYGVVSAFFVGLIRYIVIQLL